jgi:hypothetical protein
MKNKLIWRLGKLPSVEELLKLVNDKVISKEEMRDVLFNSETKEEVDMKSLEGEIKFLRELVTKLSTKSTIIETVRTIQPTYITQPWYGPYYTWCSIGTTGSYTTTTAPDGCSTTSYAIANGSTNGSGSAGGTNCFYVSSRGSAEGDDINPCSSACSVDWNTGDFDSIKTF